MRNFYLTLSSNSSMEYFSENKTSHFTVKLPKTLTLDGNWTVALVDLHYQQTFYNVAEENNKIFFKWKNKKFSDELILKSKNYESVGDIVTEINEKVYYELEWKARFIQSGVIEKPKRDIEYNFLIYDNENERLFIHGFYESTCDEIVFQNRLALILGFVPNVDAISTNLNKTRKPKLMDGIPDEILIYCDVIEPQVIGHKMAQVIRIVSVDKELTFGDTHHKEFQRLQYYPLMKKEFENISIELRDRTGQFLPFVYGNVIIVLHFVKEN